MKGRPISIIVIVLLLVLFVGILGSAWMLEVPAYLLLGWVIYPFRIVPMVRVNVAAVGVFVIALPIATWMLHRFCAWLWTGSGQASTWRWKWSIAGMAGVMLMFVIGVAATGVVHQTGWLITSPKPLVTSSRPAVNRIKCGSSLRHIGLAIRNYAKNHSGYQPATFADVVDAVIAYEESADCFVCPASDHDRAPGTQPADWRVALLESDAYSSYAFAVPGTLAPDGRAVLLYDRTIDYHQNGINLLLADGEVVFLDNPAAETWLAKQ